MSEVTDTYKLEELTTKIGSGATPRGGKNSYKEEGISLIRSLNIYDLEFDKDGLAFIDEEQANNLSNVEVEVDDVLINITGASVARCCKVPRDILPARVNQHVSILRSKKDKLNPAYLQYILVSPHYKHKLLTYAQGGATREALTKGGLQDFEIDLPPLATQNRIASMLSAFDDLISTNTRRIEILEEMARLIYREWFVHFRYPGHEDNALVDSGTDLGKIPEGWEVAYLGDLISSQYGYTESADEEDVGPMFIRGTDINKSSYIDWSGVPYCPIDKDDYEKYKVHLGDILVIRMADPGKTAIIEEKKEAVFASYLIRLIIQDDRLRPYYLFYTMNDHRYQGFISGASTGTTRKSASAKVIKDFYLVVPPKGLLGKYEKQIALLRKQLNTLLNQNNKLKETRDLLLPKLISGKVDV